MRLKIMIYLAALLIVAATLASQIKTSHDISLNEPAPFPENM